MGLDWANDDDRYSLFNPDKMVDLEQILQDNDAPTIGGLYKQRYPEAKVVALSGHKYYAAAPLGGRTREPWDHVLRGRCAGHCSGGSSRPCSCRRASSMLPASPRPPRQSAWDGGRSGDKLALASVEDHDPRMLLINYPEFDWPLGHVFGGSLDPARTKIDMKNFAMISARSKASTAKKAF